MSPKGEMKWSGPNQKRLGPLFLLLLIPVLGGPIPWRTNITCYHLLNSQVQVDASALRNRRLSVIS
jgi:hypothetical protein